METGDIIVVYGLFILWWLLCLVGLWGVFVKAGQPGWAAIVPIYNLYTWVKVADQPGWWVVLYFVPGVNLFVHITVCIYVALEFRQHWLFGIGLWLLPVVFLPVLGFGNRRAEYVGAAHRVEVPGDKDAALARRARQQMKDADRQQP